MPDTPLRVLIVDDSAFIRRLLTRMVEQTPGLEVVGTAPNGKIGVEKAIELSPDLITLDIEMPVMDGLTALARIRRDCQRPKPRVLMCSTLTSHGSREALKALSLGAADVICKDIEGFGSNPDATREQICGKLLAIGATARGAIGRLRPASEAATGHSSSPTPPMPVMARRRAEVRPRVLLIGSSTGGPPVLETILRAVPAGVPFPIVVAQHMPAMFTKSIAERLDDLCEISVEHASERTALEPGRAVIIEGGRHGHLRPSRGGGLAVDVTDDPPGYAYKPSVDALFSSAARVVGGACLAVVLTGMGEDGAEGARALAAEGAAILAQNAASSVVYGMPRAVIEAGLAEEALDPEGLAQRIASACRHGAIAA